MCFSMNVSRSEVTRFYFEVIAVLFSTDGPSCNEKTSMYERDLEKKIVLHQVQRHGYCEGSLEY